MKRTLTTHDISRLLRVDPTTVSKWIDRGMLAAFKTPGGHRRVEPKDFHRFLQDFNIPVPSELSDEQRLVLVVVDDEPGMLTSLKRQFRKYRSTIEVITTTSAIEALFLVWEKLPQGLLIDLNMPSIDGFEVCTKIRARPALKDVRVIAITAHLTKSIEEAAVKAGADAAIEKPVDAERVLELLRMNT